MAAKAKDHLIKASKFTGHLEKNKNQQVMFSLPQNKHLQLTLAGEVHKHDDKFWITQGDVKTVVEMKESGSRFSQFVNWPDKTYRLAICIQVAGQSVAEMEIPIQARDKFLFQIEQAK